jgi:hypothetical protein
MGALEALYEAMRKEGYDLDDLQTFKDQAVIFYRTDHGGIVFQREKEKPSLWWVRVLCPHEFPRRDVLLWLMRLAFLSGCEFLAIETHRPGIGRICEALGFQRISEDLYSIKKG